MTEPIRYAGYKGLFHNYKIKVHVIVVVVVVVVWLTLTLSKRRQTESLSEIRSNPKKLTH